MSDDPANWSEAEWALDDALLPVADDIAPYEHSTDPVTQQLFVSVRSQDEVIRVLRRRHLLPLAFMLGKVRAKMLLALREVKS